MFDSIVNSILNENMNVAGGAGSVLGAGVTSTASQLSADTYANKDIRVAKPLGSKVITRSRISNSIYGSKSKSKRRKRKK